ncbi:MAG TPA: hypothetical protein VN794_24395, partial [Methylomirabilota bacterium]|nr:hypothetical protein [Methylomirabilota bacterium]
RIYLRRSASLLGLQDAILRYSEICATFSFGPQQKHLRNPCNPRSKSACGSGDGRFAWCFRSFNSRSSPEGVAQDSSPAVSQVFNLHRDRIYLRRSAIPISLQDAILRYGEICAPFSFGPQQKHLRRNPNFENRI